MIEINYKNVYKYFRGLHDLGLGSDNANMIK